MVSSAFRGTLEQLEAKEAIEVFSIGAPCPGSWIHLQSDARTVVDILPISLQRELMIKGYQQFTHDHTIRLQESCISQLVLGKPRSTPDFTHGFPLYWRPDTDM
jgi:hypothetical protein